MLDVTKHFKPMSVSPGPPDEPGHITIWFSHLLNPLQQKGHFNTNVPQAPFKGQSPRFQSPPVDCRQSFINHNRVSKMSQNDHEETLRGAVLNQQEWVQRSESKPKGQDELVAEVKEIYASLEMVENECIEADMAQTTRCDDGKFAALQDSSSGQRPLGSSPETQAGL
ncbi:hypothetical protein ACHAQD_002458 [Fusarium lateritium]